MVAHLAGPVAEGGRRALAELAGIARAPAFHLPAAEERASVPVVASDGGRRHAGAEVHAGQGVAHLEGTEAQGGRRAMAQLANGTSTPALDDTVLEESARMFVADSDAGGIEAAIAEVDGRQRVTQLACPIAEVFRRALAELARTALAPTLDVPVERQGARVFVAGEHAARLDQLESGGGCGGRGGVGGPGVCGRANGGGGR
mmetsp:Transcript_78782/g.241064  ORF Transcript_78782/g.241064 Transcript_78782/m.241064 type:complete len:202 (+) Transcript_78782:4066-4671(+)